MADETPETPETEAPDVAAEETVPEAVDATEDTAAAPEPAPKAEPVTPLTPKERKAAARARRGKRRGATPEERAEARAKKAVARRRRREQEREKAKATRAAEPVADIAPRKEHGPGRPKVRQGIVTSDKGDKTITVRIDDARRHRKYQKIVRSTQKLHAHDEQNDAGTGDLVRVVECRPMSATKRWRLEEVLERAK
jgi:small subunit ribosomal protein S17